MKNLKDTVTNIIVIVVGTGTAIQTVLGNVPEASKWYVWVSAAAIVIISFFTGKGQNGKKITL